jgi:hypothetical protein
LSYSQYTFFSGSPIGNLYYFSWLSWLCSFMLIASVYEDIYGVASPDNEENDEDKIDQVVNGDIPMETITGEDNL